MLEVFDKQFKKIAILENAVQLSETQKINAIWLFNFALPYTDKKNEYCKPYNYIKYNKGDMYRILPSTANQNETGLIEYECEHVIALLLDNVMFGFHQVGNVGHYTDEVINYVLAQQKATHWVLDRCEFKRQFEYGWEQESLLGALFSIPKPFTENYMWVYDTKSYPFKVSLVKIDGSLNPMHYIRRGHNQLTLNKQSDPRLICTRLYPLGAGEGVNQVNIKRINNDIEYIESPPEIIEKYGIIERVWSDRRYLTAETLLDASKAMLAELQEPIVEYSVSFRDDCNVGDIIQIVGEFKTFITEKNVNYGEITTTNIKIANKPKNIADTIAELADRQRIETTYSQGATQIYADSTAVNADGNTPAIIRFYVPEDMININGVKAKIKLSQFRANSGSSSYGGGTYSTSSSGGGINTTSGSGGGTYKSTTSIHGTVISWTSIPINGSFDYHRHEHSVGTHGHYIDLTPHSHTVTASTHSHEFSTPSHSHTVTASAHSHEFSTPSHYHEITPIIKFFGGGSNFWLYINGIRKQYYNSTDVELELTEFLINEESQIIERGEWHEIGILPNTLSQVEISYQVVGFIQSRGNRSV